MEVVAEVLTIGAIGLVLLPIFLILGNSLINTYYNRKDKYLDKLILMATAAIQAVTTSIVNKNSK